MSGKHETVNLTKKDVLKPLTVAGAKLQLVMNSVALTSVAGILIAVLFLLPPSHNAALSKSSFLMPFIALGVFQLLLGFVWLGLNKKKTPSWIWSLGLVISSFGSGIIWGIATSQALQTTGNIHSQLLAPLLAIFLFGLHFSPLGVHLLLYITALIAGLLVTGAGTAPLLGPEQSLLFTGSVVWAAFLLGAHNFSTRLVRRNTERTLLQQEYDMLLERSSNLDQQFQEADTDRTNLVQELTNAKQAAEAADVKKNEFLAIMSHEIRTPLNGILPLLDMLTETKLDGEQRKLVNTANNSSRHLLRIINDILDFSKIEAGKLELEQVELSIKGLIDSVTGLMSNMAEKRGIRLSNKISTQVPDRLRGDPLRLRQILTNLVSNAVKFTEKGIISVEISASRATQRDVEVLFVVRDTGVGMEQETVQRLFSSFTQADASTTRKYGGTGLGLAICKRLIKVMGGQIGVRSKIGKGSLFWFVVPMRRPLGEVPAGRESLESARALLVGFNDRDLREIDSWLRRWGVTFSHCENVVTAISTLTSAAGLGNSWAQDIVIFDQSNLGTQAANSLMNEMRNTPRLVGTATVGIVTEPGEEAGLMELGVGDILTRPLRSTPFYQVMCRQLDVREEDYRESELLQKATPVTPILEEDILDKGKDTDTSPQTAVTPSPPKPKQNLPQLDGIVLLAEDNDVNRAVARKLLEKMGLEVEEAVDGAAAVRCIESKAVDLIIMDCRMPIMDGYEATKMIRGMKTKARHGRKLPIIAMTANVMAGDREKCIATGMDDYLSKPVKFDILHEMMSKWLKAGKKRPIISSAPSDKPKPKGKTMSDQPIDMNVINELRDVMEEEFTSVIESYLSNVPPLYSELRNAAVAEDVAGMVNPAHSLKSSSANVGAMTVSETAKTIEMAARNNDGATAKSAFEQLNQVLPTAVKALKAIVQGN